MQKKLVEHRGGGGGRKSLTRKHLRGFTLVELLVVIAIIGMLIALLLPAVQAAREAARRMTCTNHLKQLSLAVHTFHDAHSRFPAAFKDELFWDANPRIGRASFLTGLLPFMEQTPMYDFIKNRGGTAYRGDGGNSIRPIATFLCPSDGSSSLWGPTLGDNGNIFTCYRGSLADMPGFIEDEGTSDGTRMSPHLRSWLDRGRRTLAYVSDGTSNSIMLAEGLISDAQGGAGGRYKSRTARGPTGSVGAGYWAAPENCLNLRGARGEYANPDQVIFNGYHAQGRRAFCNMSPMVYIHTILAPNSPSCSNLDNYNNSIMCAASNHSGGVNVALLDASVRFITESIHTTNLHRFTPHGPPGDWNGAYQSPPSRPRDADGNFSYGVWSELGSVNGNEGTALP